jgi:microcystin-dependent protein
MEIRIKKEFMKNIILLTIILLTQNLWAVCSSPISRTNNSANAVLTSTKYNLDLNTVYSRTNELPGDCLTDATVSTAKIADEAVTAAKLAPTLLAQFIPAGTILPFGGTVVPSGFLLCNGQSVSRSTYADLYTAIGVAFGSGNGSTTFNMPDLRGRFLRGVDSGATRDPDRASRTAMASGGNAGDNVGSVQDDELKAHVHSQTAYWETNSGGNGYVASNASGSNANTISNIASTGGNETRPKNANVNYIIKY